MARALDLAYASDTTLVAAYVKTATPQDKIVVVTSPDRGMHWTRVYEGPLGGVQTLVQLSVDVASGFQNADHMVFIGVQGIWTTGGKSVGFQGLLSGDYRTTWTRPTCAQILPATGNQYAPVWSEMRVNCAVIPLVDVSPTDYAVGVAFKYPTTGWGAGSHSIQVAYSSDHGATVRDSRVIAGPGGEALGDIHDFGHPSLLGDPVNREVVISFHDRTTGVVQIVSALARQHIESQLKPTVAFTTATSRQAHHPELALFDANINFTCLIGAPDRNSSYELTWFRGGTLTGGWTEIRDPVSGGPLHAHAITPCDIITRRSDAFMTALCVVDVSQQNPGVGVIAFEGNRRDGSEMVKTQINDQMVSFLDPPTPKVAVAPVGASPFRAQSYGYGQFGLQNAMVLMDP
jgi:hypothetical protein